MSNNAFEPQHGRCRAQASIETLLAFLIFLSAFGLVYAAGSRLASASQSRLDLSLSQSSFSEFSSKLASACSLGNGNVRIADVKGKPAALAADGNSVAFTAGNFSATASPPCQISIAASGPSKSFHIENKEGVLEIT
ncbi:MAG: hypothetical protein WC717_05995 [Candidatus Micrarchaeia archaeon]|jgi:hypothetical protein